MGLADDLGYGFGQQNRLQRWVVALAATRLLSAVTRWALPSIDRLVVGRSQGRSTATSWVSGLPPLWVTMTGSRSGAQRTVPLFGIPIEGDLAVLGTSFGQKATPAWVHNLEAIPQARASYQGRTVIIVARPARPAEEAVIWASAARVYPGYARYQTRASHRRIRVFVLESI